MEFAYRPSPNTNCGWPTLPYVTERRERTDPEDNLRGAPELVAGGTLASNRIAEINEKEKLCLENRCLQFLGLQHGYRHSGKATSPPYSRHAPKTRK
jgi:hypothetical protein